MSKFKKQTEARLASVAVNASQAERLANRAIDSVKDIDARIDQAFVNVAEDVVELESSFNELYQEIATNGVVRDIKLLKTQFAGLDEFRQEMRAFRDSLETNGVASAINKLNKEVFVDKPAPDNFYHKLMFAFGGEKEPTLAEKVEAIIEHLGIDVHVKPAEKAKVVASKKNVKKGKK